MRQRLFLLAIILSVFAIPQSVFAYDFSASSPNGQTLYYNYTDGGVEVTHPANYGYSGFAEPAGVLIIPDSVSDGNGTKYAVVSIGDGAFINCLGLVSVTMPSTVQAIRDDAFYGCRRLHTAVLSDSLRTIGNGAFYGCSYLVGFTLPAGVVEVESNALEEVNNVIYNGDSNLQDPWTGGYIGNAKMVNGYIEDNIVYLDASKTTVMGWEGVVNAVVIPSSVVYINRWAFNRCDSLVSITIPGSVTSIGDDAFMMCEQLGSVYYLGTMQDWCNIDFGYMHGSNPGYNTNLYIDGSLVTDIVIPEGVTHIKQNTFAGIGTSVTFPSTLTAIGPNSFLGSRITHLTVPESVSEVGNDAFAECFYLQDVVFEGATTTIGSNAFRSCANLRSVVLPPAIGEISDFAFYGCTKLDSVHVPATVDYIGYDAFGACDSLKTLYYDAANCTIIYDIWGYGDNHFMTVHPIRALYVGSEVESIPEGAFANQDMLNNVYCVLDSAPTLGNNAFNPSAATTVHIPCGSYDSYSTEWGNMNFQEPVVELNLMVESSNLLDGIVEIEADRYGNNVRCDSSATIKAIPHYGHHFTHWSNGSEGNPLNITLSGDTSLVAYFESDEFTLTAIPNDTTLGAVIGGGIYINGSTVTITAVPSHGNRFDRWSDNTLLVNKTFVITQDTELVAVFVPVDTVHVHDTTYTTLFDTVVNTIYDTIVETILDTIERYIYVHDTTTTTVHDTTYLPVYIHDTIHQSCVDTIYLPQYIYDTLTVHDTVLIHDTIYITQEGIEDVKMTDIKLYQRNGQLVVEGSDGLEVRVYDAAGRLLRFHSKTSQGTERNITVDVPASGTYLVQVGDLPARKVVVVR